MALATDLNEFTHFVAKPARGHGNVTGADNVVAWQTGYPEECSSSRGHPRFNPGEFTTVDTVTRGRSRRCTNYCKRPCCQLSKTCY